MYCNINENTSNTLRSNYSYCNINENTSNTLKSVIRIAQSMNIHQTHEKQLYVSQNQWTYINHIRQVMRIEKSMKYIKHINKQLYVLQNKSTYIKQIKTKYVLENRWNKSNTLNINYTYCKIIEHTWDT